MPDCGSLGGRSSHFAGRNTSSNKGWGLGGRKVDNTRLDGSARGSRGESSNLDGRSLEGRQCREGGSDIVGDHIGNSNSLLACRCSSDSSINSNGVVDGIDRYAGSGINSLRKCADSSRCGSCNSEEDLDRCVGRNGS